MIKLDHQPCETLNQPLKCGTLHCCEVESPEKVIFLFNLNAECWINPTLIKLIYSLTRKMEKEEREKEERKTEREGKGFAPKLK